jgi:CheY-like chemotaxis protein
MTEPCGVLVVEDHSLMRELLEESLDTAGFAVQTAANGREALAVLQHWHPDVIVLDLEMPVMDGASFRAAQCRAPECSDIPVVVFSGAVNPEEQAAKLNARATLRKPCDPTMLVAVIRQVVRHQRVQTRVQQVAIGDARPRQ